MGLASFAQSDQDAIVGALKTANATTISTYFDDYVDIKLLDKAEVKNMGRNQAGITLKAFFAENGINGFEKTSQRDIGATSYLTGKLQNGDKGYNITIMLKLKEGKSKIITVRIN